MGWTFPYGAYKATQLRDDLRRDLGGLLPAPIGKGRAASVLHGLVTPPTQRGLLRDALTNYGRHYYAAFQPGDGTVTILVCLFERRKDPHSDDPASWGYKDMDESMGPYVYDCPLDILNLATDPAPCGTAAEWREEVRRYWRKRRERLATAKSLQVDAYVYLRNTKLNPFRIVQLKPLRGIGPDYGYYRIPRTRIERIEQPALAQV